LLTIAAAAGGWLHYWLAPAKRRNYLSNTSQAIDFKGATKPWRAFQSHALNLLELLRATSQDASEAVSRLSLRGAGNIDAALAAGRGLILTTMHSGNWELAGLLLASRGYPVTTVAGTQLREGWSNEIKAFKARYGIEVVSPERGMRQLYRSLQSNGIVVLHIDGDVFSGGIEASLLGRIVTVPRGPAHLSRVLGAPSAFAYCRRTADGLLEVRVETPHTPPRSDVGERELTRLHVARLEKCVLEEPGQWCIFRKL
jgi:KDO2-lipid IV(A) lauroyltransferase